MPRTTINIEALVLRDLKRLQKREGKTLGRVVSDLLAEAVGRHLQEERAERRFEWISRPMSARVDLEDKDELHRALDSGRSGR